MVWPEAYTFTREEMLALVKKLDGYSETFRSAFLACVVAASAERTINLFCREWPPERLTYLGRITGADERVLIRCFENIRYGDAPVVMTEEGHRLLHLIAEFYPEEIAEHIGPFSKHWAHLRPPPKPKKDKKDKAHEQDG